MVYVSRASETPFGELNQCEDGEMDEVDRMLILGLTRISMIVYR